MAVIRLSSARPCLGRDGPVRTSARAPPSTDTVHGSARSRSLPMAQATTRGQRPAEAPAPRSNHDTAQLRGRSSVRVRSHRAATTRPIDLPTLAAAIIGLLVAAYLATVDLTNGTTLCLAGSDCDVVRASSFGRVAGVPVAVLGVGYFVAVLVAVGAAHYRRPGALQ